MKAKTEFKFYTVGRAIPFTGQLNSTLFGMSEKQVSKEDILNSFPEDMGKIKLFERESEALEYSRSLRKALFHRCSDYTKAQPAVFQVAYKWNSGNINFEEEVVTINAGSEPSDIFPELGERKINLKFFLVDRKDVQPLTGSLKVQQPKGKNDLIHFGSVNYSPPGLTNLTEEELMQREEEENGEEIGIFLKL